MRSRYPQYKESYFDMPFRGELLQDFKQKITVHWPLINRLARRRFNDNLAEEAALYVLNQLQEDDCRRVRSFSGRAGFSTFLSSLTIRLLEDFSRKRFGRVRPPQWISALGGIWIAVFELLCLQRLNVSATVETMLHRIKDRAQVEQTAWTILERVTDCGRQQALEVEFDDEVRVSENNRQAKGGHLKGPEERFMESERRDFFEVLFMGLFAGEKEKQLSAFEHSFVRILAAGIELSAQERLLIKLCFQDGISATRAGKMLGLNANQIHGKLRRLLTRLRIGFELAGIDEELKRLLEE